MRALGLAAVLALAACGDNLPPDPWQLGPALPGGRLEPGVVAVGDALWVIGGFDDGVTVVDDVWVLDPGADTWRAGPTAPAALTHAGLVVVDGTLYLLGGLIGHTWASLPALPEPRSHAVGARAPDGAALVIGGLATLDAVSARATVLALPGDGDAWAARTAMPTARGGCAAAVIDGALLCAGGEAGASALRVAEAYDLAADTWRALPALPVARAGTHGAAIAGALWIPGGAHALRYQPLDTVLFYAP